MQSAKTSEPYCKIIASIRCRISFVLLRSSVMCLRGARRVFPLPDSSTSSGAHSGGRCNSTWVVSLQLYIHSKPCIEYCSSSTTNMFFELFLTKFYLCLFFLACHVTVYCKNFVLRFPLIVRPATS